MYNTVTPGTESFMKPDRLFFKKNQLKKKSVVETGFLSSVREDEKAQKAGRLFCFGFGTRWKANETEADGRSAFV